MSTIPTARRMHPRTQLLEPLPVSERRRRLAGIDTAVLEGGSGAPVVLLHGPAANALHFMRAIPMLVARHRVVAPDLPGHGATTLDGAIDDTGMMAWLNALIAETCGEPPVLVGHAVGGAIAARYAADHGDRIARLVLVDTLGLRAFEPAPAFGGALQAFFAAPTPATHDALWQHCAWDLASLRSSMRDEWDAFQAYNLDRVRTPAVMAAIGSLMEQFSGPIPPEQLARIRVPTSLVWGRHDRATPLAVAQAAADRYGWSLRIIEDCADDPPVERPAEFAAAISA